MSYPSKNFRVRNVTPEEMNEHLKFVECFRKISYGELIRNDRIDIERDMFSNTNALIQDNPVIFKLTYSRGGECCTYQCRKDGTVQPDNMRGSDALRSLGFYYKVPRIENKHDYTSKPLSYVNPLYEGRRIQNCIGYDVNKCYRWAMLQPMPDTSVPPRCGTIQKGSELGFFLDAEEDNFIMIYEGYSNWIFPILNDNPFQKFIERWSKEKDVQKSKGIINSLSGVLKHTNYYLRAAIVSYARHRMESLIDENTLLCNTDSIVSLCPRPDLPVSDNIGDFKIEHEGSFVYRGTVYQWNYEVPVWRGISKARFGKHYDLEKDGVPEMKMPYYYDQERNRIRKL